MSRLEHPSDVLFACHRRLAFLHDIFCLKYPDARPVELTPDGQDGLANILIDLEVTVKKVADGLADKQIKVEV